MLKRKNAKKAAKWQVVECHLDMEVIHVTATMDHFLNRNYGPRCEEYEPDCCVCKGWHLRDVFHDHIK